MSTRYHPIVFAVASTTPSLFLHQDRYTLVKGCGALRLAGLSSWTLPVAGAAAGLLVPAAMELWTRRHDIREPSGSASRRQSRRHDGGTWRDLLSVLASPRSLSAGEGIPVSSGPAARGEWVEQAYEALAR